MVATCLQNVGRVKNMTISTCIAICLHNVYRVKNMLQAACMAACFKNGDGDDKSLV